MEYADTQYRQYYIPQYYVVYDAFLSCEYMYYQLK